MPPSGQSQSAAPFGPPEPAPLRFLLSGPTRRELAHAEQIDWHDHAQHQLIHPGRGVLQVFTPHGSWVVPSHRAVWLPAGVAHAHRAHGSTRMQTLAFAADVNPLSLERPTVLAVSPLLREVITALTAITPHGTSPNGAAPPAAAPTARERHNLEQVALDQLRRVEALPLHLPAPSDDRLLDVAALLAADPADSRPLGALGAAVGASERTLSRLFRQETGMTFTQWRAQLRLHHALTLLATGVPVGSAAAACGYGSASAFIEAFRKAFGTTPGRYWTD
jgi:AraC-like DNA-binding protein